MNWLDKYSDDVPKAQKGQKVKYVESKNDPRYKAYQDSLSLYKSTPIRVAELKKINKKIVHDLAKKTNKVLKSEMVKVGNEPFNKNRNRGYYQDDNKMILGHDSSIKPISFDKYQMKKLDGSGVFKYFDGNNIQTDDFGVYKKPKEQVIVNLKTNQSLKPKTQPNKKYNSFKTNNPDLYNTKLTNGDVPRYADGTPVYVNKPQQVIKKQPVVVKPKPKQLDLPRVENVNLPPMQQMEQSAIVPIGNVREPKSYNVNMQRYNMEGPSKYYNADEQNIDYNKAIQIKNASDAYNKNIEKRYGPQNEYRNTRSAEKAAERFKQLRSESEITPNYRNGGQSTHDGLTTEGFNYNGAWGGQFQMGGKLNSSIPVIEDAGNYNEEGSWVPDWKTMAAQAKKLGAKKVKTKHGSLIVFNDNWEVVGVDDNPDAMQMGGDVYPVNYVPQAQMGTSIPGAVGFSYARTQSPAPSNGKYAKKTMASAQNGQEMKFYQEGLDFKPKNISKNGSVIKDDRGQWDHPGEITEISGNTMATHGYGDIPLYVVPDKGKPRMVQPNTGIQKFPGAKKFTEYPVAKDGKELVKLNQLTNFTNYNTKQPGGWMDKYQ